MIGAAPVPVPPPMPAVIKTRSAPSTAWAMSSLDSSAAFCPIAGLPPAPSPFVSFTPIWKRFFAWERRRAWASVLKDQNSTPVIWLAIMRFTALPPPPPTPITLILAVLLGMMFSPLGSGTYCCFIVVRLGVGAGTSGSGSWSRLSSSSKSPSPESSAIRSVQLCVGIVLSHVDVMECWWVIWQ